MSSVLREAAKKFFLVVRPLRSEFFCRAPKKFLFRSGPATEKITFFAAPLRYFFLLENLFEQSMRIRRTCTSMVHVKQRLLMTFGSIMTPSTVGTGRGGG